MTTAASRTTPAPRTSRLAAYLLALGAGATWGTTGPLSTGLYGLMPATSIGFWRGLLGTVCLGLWARGFRREVFRVDPRGGPLGGLGGGIPGGPFELAFPVAHPGAGLGGGLPPLFP